MIFFKQYGERRTGTNVLRALLTQNYRDVTVLLHVLGDKHAPPVDLAPLAGAADDDEVRRLVEGATLAARAKTTALELPAQRRLVDDLAPALAEAVRGGDLRFLISVKDPYAWAASWLRWNGWQSRERPAAEREPMVCEVLRFACQEANRKHRAWLALHDGAPARASLVRFEDLLEEPGAVLARIEEQHGLARLHGELALIDETVDATQWDDRETRPTGRRFDRDFYRRGDYLNELTPRMRDVITRSIDWPLLHRFGYIAR